jgi:hypothetical protein
VTISLRVTFGRLFRPMSAATFRASLPSSTALFA